MNLLSLNSLGLRDENLIGSEGRTQHRERARVARAYAEWLAGFEWDHYVDLTSRNPLTDAQLLHVFKYQWIRWLEKSAQNAVRWAVFPQRGESNGRHHLHGLLYGTSGLHIDEIDRAWRLGLARVRIFDPTKGATGYITREVAENGDWDISMRMPPRQARQHPTIS